MPVYLLSIHLNFARATILLHGHARQDVSAPSYVPFNDIT
jgi:hypothetical protein